MFFKTEEVNLLSLAVPVAPDALKDSGAVVEGMGHNSYPGFFQGNKLLLKKGIRRHFKVSFPVTVHYNYCGDRKTSRVTKIQFSTDLPPVISPA